PGGPGGGGAVPAGPRGDGLGPVHGAPAAHWFLHCGSHGFLSQGGFRPGSVLRTRESPTGFRPDTVVSSASVRVTLTLRLVVCPTASPGRFHDMDAEVLFGPETGDASREVHDTVNGGRRSV